MQLINLPGSLFLFQLQCFLLFIYFFKVNLKVKLHCEPANLLPIHPITGYSLLNNLLLVVIRT